LCQKYQSDKNHLLKKPFFAVKLYGSRKKGRKTEGVKTQKAFL
jgi:hypothetical protein